MRTFLLLFKLSVLILALHCATPNDWKTLKVPNTAWRTQTLMGSAQDWSGNPEEGLLYILYGDMLGTGVPMDLMQKRLQKEPNKLLAREGDNSVIQHGYTAFTAANGVRVMNGNCFNCHAGYINGRLILGMGETQPAYQKSIKVAAWGLNRVVNKKYKKGTPEREAFGNFGDYYKAIPPYVQTANPGTTPAFRLEEACVMHRNPADLSYRPEPGFEMMRYTIPSDVPPLWNIDKKNALYYNGMGRGDFRKLLMQAIVLATPDSTAARGVFNRFTDVLAWTASLQPPPYPFALDNNLVAKGKVLFEEHCQDCHGNYTPGAASYPNLLVSINEVKTDPLYAVYLADRSGLAGWFNQSWFAQSEPKARMEASYGYMAPPLDGIWATAPYFHNASVPTLEDVLNSPNRPRYWRRTYQPPYDPEKAGWQYSREKSGKDKNTYDTTLPGYGNGGHTYGDQLSNSERRALVEYLKTL